MIFEERFSQCKICVDYYPSLKSANGEKGFCMMAGDSAYAMFAYTNHEFECYIVLVKRT